METKSKPRRPKGPSPRGTFEDSKRAAQLFHEQQKEADRLKTAKLKEQRLARRKDDQGTP